jgi:hypothetical protein
MPSKLTTLGELLGARKAAQLAREVEQEAERARIGSLINKTPETPNFELVGEPQSHGFQLKGEPYGGSVAKIPDAILPPEGPGTALAVNGGGMPTQLGNVQVIDGKIVAPNSSGLGKAWKVGAGAAGLGGLAALYGGGEPPVDPQSRMAASDPTKDAPPVLAPNNQPEEVSETEKTLKRLIATLGSGKKNAPMEVDLTGANGAIGTDENLIDAQERAANARFVSGIGKAGDIIG